MENHNTIVNINSYLASFSICETTSFEVQTRNIRISLRGPSITKKIVSLQFSVRMMYLTKEKSFIQHFLIRYLDKSEWLKYSLNLVYIQYKPK